jgi:hypothetical protein
MEALRPTAEGENDISDTVDVGHGERLAADLAITDPVDQNLAPVEGLDAVRQREADLADALVVHEKSVRRKQHNGKTKEELKNLDKVRQSAVQ